MYTIKTRKPVSIGKGRFQWIEDEDNGYSELTGLSHCLQCGTSLPKTEKFFCSKQCEQQYN